MTSNQNTIAKHKVNRKYLILGAFAFVLLFLFWLAGGDFFSRSMVGNTDLNLLSSGWDYFPGVTPQTDGLHVSYVGQSIVRQNGTSGQSNPTVNIYGTHLRVADDFTLTATMSAIKGTASLRLYSSPPIIQDEFRVEPRSLELNIRDNTLVISIWGDYNNQDIHQQLPALMRTHSIQPQDNNKIVIQRRDQTLLISVNEKQIESLPENGLFEDELWFGMRAVNPGDSWVLADLHANISAGSNVINLQNAAIIDKADQSLQSLASRRRPGFMMGAAMALGPAVADKKYMSVAFGGNFGQMTTENALKWQFIHPQPALYNFREADALIAIAEKNNLSTHGHTLVFGEANPKWVQDLPSKTATDREYIKQVMIDHITQTVAHFKGRVASWDVVNEPLADYGMPVNPNGGLRQHKWYAALGEGYIATAFETAHQADPKAKLYINEFGLEMDDDRWKIFLALVAKLKSSGVPIDGVGFQAHVYEPDDEIDPSVLRDRIRALANLGLTSRISEMDVYNENGTANQADQYVSVLSVCISEPSCVSWSTWGVTDRYNLSLDDKNRLQYGHDYLWDQYSVATPAVTKMRQFLSQ